MDRLRRAQDSHQNVSEVLFEHLDLGLRRGSLAVIRLSSSSVTPTGKVRIPWAGKDRYCTSPHEVMPPCVRHPDPLHPSRTRAMTHQPTNVDPESQGATFSSSEGLRTLDKDITKKIKPVIIYIVHTVKRVHLKALHSVFHPLVKGGAKIALLACVRQHGLLPRITRSGFQSSSDPTHFFYRVEAHDVKWLSQSPTSSC